MIVSRASGKALTKTDDVGSPVQQFTQDLTNQNQFWTLEPTGPQPLPPAVQEDFLIHPFLAPGLAITVNRNRGDDPTQPAPLDLDANAAGQVWHISRIANPAYFYLLEGNDDLLMDVPGSSGDDGVTVQVYFRNENQNQQWTFLPAFNQLGA